MDYDHKKIEKKWQEIWEKERTYRAEDQSSKSKFYALIEFPYPSGDGLHVGHPRPYIGMDVIARKRRLENYNVLYPIGWDAFGLPTENYAIKTSIPPAVVTKQNTDTFRRQIKMLGTSFDWSREINTTDPKYYKWTQWIFLQFYKHGLAYKAKATINWCPKDKIGLANEEVINGKCERCGTEVVQREKEQWMLAITKYADRLDKDLDSVDYLPQIKTQQRNWIGRSEGAEINFLLDLLRPSGEVIFASNNLGKLNRLQKLLKAANTGLTLKLPKDIGIENFDVVEDGKTLEENAEKKALALSKLTDMPILSDDTGFFIAGENLDFVTVKRNALNGVDEKTLTTEQIGQKMADYYQNIAKKQGGEVEAEWRHALCFVTPEKAIIRTEAVRPVTLTDKPHGEIDFNLPIRHLYKSKVTNKFAFEQTEDEELKELEPIISALGKMFTPTIPIFTTRPDTIFGATYLVLAPEHLFIEGCLRRKMLENNDEVTTYIKKAVVKDHIERTAENKTKTGVELKGVMAINPATNEKIPMYVADYVLPHYGTGAIMAVPAHDERDRQFAEKYNLPIKEVLKDDVLINSGKFTGAIFKDSQETIVEFVGGKMVTTYKLRDWIFSRQRYWGEPIPIIHCSKCGYVPVPEKDLPVVLPEVENYQPTDIGESPLANITDWVNVKCPTCGGTAKRETDTMPNWAGSSWYYLRYTDPENAEALASAENLKYWIPVDWYNGGMEHTTLHLLYSRFWHKFLYDIKIVPTNEPYKKRTSHGFILAPDGEKMSKSRGNVINPDEVVDMFGADTLRLYEMFIGPFEQAVKWSTDGILGPRRFLEKVWRLQEKINNDDSDETTQLVILSTIKKVSEDIEGMRFNTAVSAMMILVNHLEKVKNINKSDFQKFLIILSPFCPHICEEIWQNIGNEKSIQKTIWPEYDESLLSSKTSKITVQVNGKMRGVIEVEVDVEEADIKRLIESDSAISKWLNKPIKKTIFIKGKLINFVI